MQGTKPGVRKPIALKKLLLGLENIYEPDLGTTVKISCETKCFLNGHRAWLRKMMPTWIKQLNFYSGGNVLSWSISKSKTTGGFQVDLEMFFQGAMNNKKMHPKTAAMLSGQMRKLIAMEVIKAYPPPFNVREPIFAAESYDFLKIELEFRREKEIVNFLAGMKEEETISKIKNCFEKHDAQFIRFFKSSKGFMTYGILFKWTKDITTKERTLDDIGIRTFLHDKFNVNASLH
ncbi:MAG: hypothetical protein HGA36_03465 [Candidatus Moranbacteria bacterium]|nr:hypothetical protein [Candidatus Moranbacteria bacterium]